MLLQLFSGNWLSGNERLASPVGRCACRRRSKSIGHLQCAQQNACENLMDIETRDKKKTVIFLTHLFLCFELRLLELGLSKLNRYKLVY